MAYLDGGLLCCRYRQNRACRTDFRAFGAFRPAVSSFVRHFRLHQSHQSSGWSQHIVRADRYAQLAGRAVLIEMFQADGSRRDDCRLPFRNLLVGDDGKPAINLFLLGVHRGGCGDKGSRRKEVPSPVGRVRAWISSGFCGRCRSLTPVSERIAYRPMRAVVDTVHACHTAAVVYRVSFVVDA